MSELKINNVSVLTESGGEVTGTLKTLKMGATTVFTESGGTVTAQNMGFSANDAGVKTALNASGDAPVYACRAWVNFEGTNTNDPFTLANGGIRAAGNVSSITDNTLGDYTVNFVTAMPDTNYCVCGSVNTDVEANTRHFTYNPTFSTGSVNVYTQVNYASTEADDRADASVISVAIFR